MGHFLTTFLTTFLTPILTPPDPLVRTTSTGSGGGRGQMGSRYTPRGGVKPPKGVFGRLGGGPRPGFGQAEGLAKTQNCQIQQSGSCTVSLVMGGTCPGQARDMHLSP